jgi:hypothetical protein
MNKLDLFLSMIPKNGATVLTINKEMASLMLERNYMNRSIQRKKVEEYKLDMNKMDWHLNGETIKFDQNGKLIDGQKRLIAFIESNLETIELMFVTGLDRDLVFTKIDRGQTRTAANAFEFIGVQNSTLVSTMIKNIVAFGKGNYGDRGGTNRVMTREDMISFYRNDDENIQRLASISSSLYKKSGCLILPGAMAALVYLFTQKSEKQAIDFFEKFASGTNLASDSPILILRNKILRSKSNPRERLTQSELIKLIIISWNKYRANETCKVLKIPETIVEIN